MRDAVPWGKPASARSSQVHDGPPRRADNRRFDRRGARGFHVETIAALTDPPESKNLRVLVQMLRDSVTLRQGAYKLLTLHLFLRLSGGWGVCEVSIMRV